MKYVFPVLVCLFIHVASSFAKAQEYLNEERIEDTWTVAVMDNDTNDPKQWEVIASVNGQVIHGDRLRIRLVPKGGQACRYGNTFTYFYTVTGNQDTINLKDVIVPAEFKNELIQVHILFAQPFLLGYAVFIDLGWNKLGDIKHFFKDQKDVTLTLKDSERLNISEYFDIAHETYSLIGLNQALGRAQQECERIVKMSNSQNFQRKN